MTASRPCYFGNLLLGVVGVDVNLAYILEDVTYHQDSLASYTFLIDNKGTLPISLSLSILLTFYFVFLSFIISCCFVGRRIPCVSLTCD